MASTFDLPIRYSIYRNTINNNLCIKIGECSSGYNVVIPFIVIKNIINGSFIPEFSCVYADNFVVNFEELSNKISEEEVMILLGICLNESASLYKNKMFKSAIRYAKKLMNDALVQRIKTKPVLNNINFIKKLMNMSIYEPYVSKIYNDMIKKESNKRYKIAMIKKIQKNYRHAIGNPYTDLCKIRLINELNQMNSEI